ncbi:hypothetical protein BH10ACT11_BH10ACT11_08070 [soil metagenome]
MKRIQITILALLLTLAVGVLAAGPADAGKAQNALRAKSLNKQLRKQGLDPVHSLCIPDQRGGGVVFSYRCSWQAKGRWTGSVPYRCYGKAGYVVEKKAWTIDPCVNKIGPRIPLAPKPLARPMFGFNDDWGVRPGKLTDLKKIGAGVARQNLWWGGIETTPGRYDWTHYDDLYRKMEAAGIRPLWVLLGAPCWAQPNPAGCSAGHTQLRPTPANYDELADFAAAAAARYPDAVGMEVWNEPNFAPFWGGAPDPDSYSQMLSAVASAMSDSPMPVISGGLSPHGDGKSTATAMDQTMFLRKMFEDGAAQMADGIGTHPYPSTRQPGRIVDQLRARMGDLRETMAEFGAEDMPLWVTEVGVSTVGTDKLSSKEQGKALADIYKTLRRVRQVPLVVFHRFVAGSKASGDREPGFGVLDPKGHRKPAFCMVARALGKRCG